MKVIFSGLESSGKSLALAEEVDSIISRNGRWFKKTNVKRPIVSNLKFSVHVEERASDLNVPILYWENLEELVQYADCDVIIDEIGNYFDSRKWADLPISIRKWLSQGAKTGIEMYGTAQDFAQVDKAFRRLTTDLYHITKIMGSRRPTPTKPPVRSIWGVCMKQTLNPRAYKEDDQKFDTSGFPWFFFIRKKYCDMYDTRQKIEVGNLPPLRHVVQYCEHFESDDPNHRCDFKKLSHS